MVGPSGCVTRKADTPRTYTARGPRLKPKPKRLAVEYLTIRDRKVPGLDSGGETYKPDSKHQYGAAHRNGNPALAYITGI